MGAAQGGRRPVTNREQGERRKTCLLVSDPVVNRSKQC